MAVMLNVINICSKQVILLYNIKITLKNGTSVETEGDVKNMIRYKHDELMMTVND